jgi:uncharacterized membrane protein
MEAFTVFGVNILEVSVRWLHAGMVAGWLLFDFLVYWLHFDVKNPEVPLAARIERARIMHGIDRIVAYIFVLTLPVGILLCYLTGNAPFSSTWLTWKHFLYAVIVVDGLVLIPISGTALRNLRKIEAGAPNVDELNHQIKHHMNIAMPAVFVVWGLVIAISVLTLLNLKVPEGQEYFFRKTAVTTSVEQLPG